MKMEYIRIADADGLMVLADEDGNTASFEFLEMYVRDGAEYAVLLQPGDDMVTILRMEEKGADGKERYFFVEDDDLFESLYDAFMQDHGDEFDFEQ